MRVGLALIASATLHLGVAGALVRGRAARVPRADPTRVVLSGAPAHELDLVPFEPAAADTDRPPTDEGAVRATRRHAARVAGLINRAIRERPAPAGVPLVGPPGSRVTALLRLDRIRGTPYAAAIDDIILAKFGAGRDLLLQRTGIEPSRDFDAIVVVLPDPSVPAAGFLAVRHHLPEAELRAALEAGARDSGRTLTWRAARGRGFGERGADGEAGGDAHRLLLFPAPDLFVLTPAAYRSLFVGAPAARRRAAALAPAQPIEETSWATFMGRIDEDDRSADDAVLVVSMADLVPPADATWLFGLPLPRAATIRVGIASGARVDVTMEADSEATARAWQRGWPLVINRLNGDVASAVPELATLVHRAHLARDANTLSIRSTLTHTELLRLLHDLR